ncbi:MAG: methyltransferase domain-containing protein, partial [Solobacterium sp.]|nr:methyltransferase domain-containing protein [Solobacterium sp.]
MHFICPICKQELMVTHRTLSCKQGHSFDIAKSGYYPLYLSQKKEHGDNAQLVQARIHFLEQDHYLFLKEEIIDCFKQYPITSCMDLGCGEGYYTRALPCNEVVGFDLSKKAIDYAQKKDKKHQYVVSSIFSLPLKEHSIDAALTIFAPLAKEEILRILKPNGYLIFVSPAEDHLIELKEYLYEKAYR